MRLVFKFLFIIFLSGMAAVLNAQQFIKIDSLKRKLSNDKMTDTAIVWIYHELSHLYIYISPDTSLLYADSALELAKSFNYVRGAIRGKNDKGNVYWIIGKHTTAIKIYLDALANCDSLTDTLIKAITLNNLGIVYYDQEEYEKSLEYYKLANKNPVKAADRNIKYIVFKMNLSEAYGKLNEYDSSIKYIRQALWIAENIRNDDYLGKIYNNLANLSTKTNHDSAIYYYELSKTYYTRMSDYHGLCNLNLDMCQFSKTKNEDSTISYAKTALNYANLGKYFLGSYKAYRILSEHYKTENKDSAVFYLEKLIEAKDSLFSKEKVKELQVLSIEEQMRQAKLEELTRASMENRINNIKLAGIATFIPSFFGLIILLRKKKVRTKTIEILGLMGLLFFFEFLTLLLHPQIEKITHHETIAMFIILVAIAAILAPFHHMLEKFVKERIGHR